MNMIKLTVSYEDEKELYIVLSRFKGKIKKVKRSNNNEGPYKKAYVTLKDG